MLARLFSKCFKLGFSSTRTKNFQVYKLDLEKAEELQIKSPTFAGTRDQIVNIHWIIEKARDCQENIYFCFIDYAKAFNCVDHNKLWKIIQEMNNQLILPISLESYMQIKRQKLEPDREQWTGSKFEKEYINVVYYNPTYLTFLQSTSY